MIKYVGPLVIYKIIDPCNYLLMTLYRKILQGLFEHEQLKPAILRTSEGNISNLSQLKQMINVGLTMTSSLNEIGSLIFVDDLLTYT